MAEIKKSNLLNIAYLLWRRISDVGKYLLQPTKYLPHAGRSVRTLPACGTAVHLAVDFIAQHDEYEAVGAAQVEVEVVVVFG